MDFDHDFNVFILGIMFTVVIVIMWYCRRSLPWAAWWERQSVPYKAKQQYEELLRSLNSDPNQTRE